MESYASICNVTAHSKDDQRAINTLEKRTRLNSERYEVGILWREDEVNLPSHIYSAMGQLMALERRLQNVETLKKRYQETNDTDISAGYVPKLDQVDLNGTRYKLQWFLPRER